MARAVAIRKKREVAWDWKHPDYTAVIEARMENIDRIRQGGDAALQVAMDYYGQQEHYADFIHDWGYTFDPRNADIGQPTLIPFLLFPKQREWITWVLDRWRNRRPGLCEKSRDMGVSWLAMALSSTMCLFNDGIVIGIGSRKAEYVDKIGQLKPLFPKGRQFLENLPPEFQGGWLAWRDAPFMRISIPNTGSLISGEAGDDIGRGDRTTIYFVDEYAHFPRADITEAALSQTTNCRIDMSSVRGMNNAFARKRWEGKVNVFIFDWHDDPRKDQAWYEKQCEDLDPVVVAQEIDRDYQASVTGIVIPGLWARACVDAHKKLGIAPSGAKTVSLDIADEGLDKNAICRGLGVEVLTTTDWSGKHSDLFETCARAFEICDEDGVREFYYDEDGIGATMKGDSRVLNDARAEAGIWKVQAIGYRGSEGVVDPDGLVEGTARPDEKDKGRTNKDYFKNQKAQAWWSLRRRAQKTYRWVVEGKPCPPDEILSINSSCPNHLRLIGEMSQATYTTNAEGKIIINKNPPGTKSPNLADAVVIKFAPRGPAAIAPDHAFLSQVARYARRRR